MELFRLFGSVMIDNKDAINKLKESDNRARESSRMFAKMGDAAKKVGKVVAVGVAAGATALVGMAQKSAATADAIHKGSQRMGISMKGYQELEYWASQNGLAQDQLEKGVGRLNQRMGLAADGNKKYAGALKAVGVDMKGVKDGTLSTEDAFAQAIKTLSGMKNEQEKAALASELFGTKLGRDLLPTLQDGSLSLEEAKKKAQEMGMVLSDDSVLAGVKFTDTMDTLKRTLGGLVTKLGAAVIPKLQMFLDFIIANMPLIKEKTKAAVDGAKAAVDKFKTAIQYLQDRANVLIPVLAGLVGALTAFKIITGIASAISKMKLLMTAWKMTTFAQTLAQSGLNAALLANPIGLVIAAIAALIAIGVALYMNMDGFKEKTQQVFGFMKTYILKAVDVIVGFVQQQLGTLLAFWKQNGDQIMGILRSTWNIIVTIVKVALNLLSIVFKGQLTVLLTVMKVTWEAIKVVVQTVVSIITGIVKTWLAIFRGDWSGAWNAIKSTYQTIWNAIKAFLSNTLNIMLSTIKRLFGLYKTYVSTAMSGIRTIVTTIWNSIKSSVMNILEGIKIVIMKVWNGLKTYFAFVMNVYRTIFTSAWNAIKAATLSVMNAIKSTIRSVWTSIKASIQSVLNSIRSVITSTMNGIKSVIQSIMNAIKSVIMSVWNGIKAYYSGVFNALRSIVSSAFNAMRSVIQGIMSGIRSTVMAAWNGIRSGIVSAVNSIRSTVSSVFNSVRSAIVNPIQSAKSTVLGIIGAIKGAFSSMHITIPKPKIPSISVSMGSKKVGGISIPYPQFSVAWHAKGGIFDQPTLFNTPGGLHGVGEAGPEAILPLNRSTLGGIGDGIARNMHMQGMLDKLDAIADLLRDQDYQIVMQNGALVGALRKEIDRQLGNEKILKGRGRS